MRRSIFAAALTAAIAAVAELVLALSIPASAAQSNTPAPPQDKDMHKAISTFAKTIAAQRAARGQGAPNGAAPAQKGNNPNEN